MTALINPRIIGMIVAAIAASTGGISAFKKLDRKQQKQVIADILMNAGLGAATLALMATGVGAITSLILGLLASGVVERGCIRFGLIEDRLAAAQKEKRENLHTIYTKKAA